MGRPEGPPTKTVTIVLAKGTWKRLAALAVDAEMPVSSYIRKELEQRYPTMLPESQPAVEATPN